MTKHISIALDGPAGAGKSTMAKAVAKDLGFVYVDTGAIYRTIGYHMSLYGIGPKDTDGVTRLIDDVNIEIAYNEAGEQRMLLNGVDVTGELRTQQMSDYASKISTMKVVRDYLLDVQRDLAKKHDVIMDGRDIGTVVLPDADVKIYLTASAEVRAQRRYSELSEKAQKKTSLKQVLAEIQERDHRDMNRPVAPLKQAHDAILLDTSPNTIEQSIAAIEAIIKEKLGR